MSGRPAGRRLRWAGLLCAIGFAGLAGAAAPSPSTAREWLERMNEAVGSRTYDAEFVHLGQGQAERLRILHRRTVSGVEERLVSLSGSGREVIRNRAGVYCYLADQRRVLVEAYDARGPLLGALPAFDVAALEASYEPVLRQRVRSLIGTPAMLVDVRPRDRHRFGYRLWIDEASYMPVRTELYDADGRVLEQVLFLRLDFPAHLPSRELKPALDVRGYTYVSQERALLRSPAALPWDSAELPPGFHLAAAAEQVLQGGGAPALHLVLSDGLATVSVFVEQPVAGRPVREGQGSVGSAYAMSRLVGGQHVTAIGEVPPDTVRLIAAAIESAAGGGR
jgi:sigma-E factor negative regulatory protein RseB